MIKTRLAIFGVLALYSNSTNAQFYVGGELQSALVERVTVLPTPDIEGRIVWDTNTKTLFINDGSGYVKPAQYGASEIAFVPVGALSATTVQGAIAEVETIASNGLQNIDEDTTPQLGANLDVNGFEIASSVGPIVFNPNTEIVLDGLKWPTADGTTGQVLKTDGAGQIYFANGSVDTEILFDSTPQLGGNLDVNSWSIVSVTGGDIPITPDTTGSVVLDGLKWPQADGTPGYVLKTDGAGQLSWGGANLADDTSPQLGGDLDVNGFSIISASNGDIAITPDGTGNVVLDGVNWPQADGSPNYVLKTDGAGQLSWGPTDIVYDLTPQLGGNLDVNGQSIISVSAGDIAITPDTTGNVVLDGLNWPQADGSPGFVLKTDGAGQLSWGGADVVNDLTPQLGGDLDVNGNSIVSVSAGDIAITPDTTGNIVLDGLNWPQADGSPGFVLKTDGAGQLSWGGADVVNDLTPQLGGNLDVNGQSIVSVSNGDIPITPDGTGTIILDGLNWPQADGSPNQVLVTDGAGNLGWGSATVIESRQNDEAITLNAGDIVYVNGSGNVELASSSLIDKNTLLGVVVDATIAAAASGQIQFSGKVGGFVGLAPGSLVYVATVAGDTTQAPGTIPTTGRLYALGRALSATELILTPEYQHRIIDHDFDIGAGGVTEVTVSDQLDKVERISVKINGTEYREGAGNDYTVDTGLDKILFTFTVPEDAFVRVTVFQ